MASKKIKKIIGAIGAGLAAHAMSKAGASGSKALSSKYFGGLKTGDANVAENLGLWDKGMDKIAKQGGVSKEGKDVWKNKKSWKPDWWPWNKGGAIKAYQGQLVKSETRGTGAAVKGTTHEVMPGMNAAKSGKMIHAKQGYFDKEDESIGMRLGKKKTKHDTMVRTRGANPDSSWTTQGGEVKVATKLNGVLTTRTW